MHGFFKIALQNDLTGQVPEWCEGIEPEAHIRWCFDPVTIGIALTVASTVLQASSTLAAGKAQQRAAEHQAAQGRQQAGQERASSQRAAIEQRRQGRVLSSRALALAAASGAGAGDPTVENILGGIGAEGEFRALNELFIGEERARGLETQADLRIFEGKEARKASKTKAFSQVLGGAATAASFGQGLSRYGSATGESFIPDFLRPRPPIPRRRPSFG